MMKLLSLMTLVKLDVFLLNVKSSLLIGLILLLYYQSLNLKENMESDAENR